MLLGEVHPKNTEDGGFDILAVRSASVSTQSNGEGKVKTPC